MMKNKLINLFFLSYFKYFPTISFVKENNKFFSQNKVPETQNIFLMQNVMESRHVFFAKIETSSS